MLSQSLFQVVQETPKEFELILKSTDLVAKYLNVPKVNFLINTQEAPDFTSGKTGTLLPIDYAGKVVKCLWQIEASGESFALTEPVSAELLVAGKILTLALENISLRAQTVADGLTKLYNRAHFDRCLSYEMERAKRYFTPFSLLLLDIDKFKNFNDTYGHLAGDEVLKIVASVMKDNTRSSDLVFRYGGEEFAIILPHVDKKDADRLANRLKSHVDATVSTAERLRETIRKHPLQHDGQDIPISVSIGITAYAGTEKDLTPSQMIERADEALYRAKDMGRDRSEVIGKEDHLRILIVDDEQDYCNLLSDYFMKREYDVATCTSGTMAVELINNNPFDLVFLDLKMPGMSGVEVLERVKNVAKRMRIVALTGVHDNAIKKVCYDFGICEYLEKPVSIEYIDKKLMARILEMNA